jgi:hypothetical protein
MSDPRQEAFEIAGHVRVSITDLEILAADISDGEVDRLVEVLRYDTIRLGDRLTLLKYERLRELGEA